MRLTTDRVIKVAFVSQGLGLSVCLLMPSGALRTDEKQMKLFDSELDN